jgi:hypothetical protein
LTHPREDTSFSDFWNKPVNFGGYPHLQMLAKKYLSAPASSCESERLFSTARFIMSDLRNRLSGENLRKLLFLHHNLSLIELL